MKITEIRKKVKKCKDLLSEYNSLYVLSKAMQRNEIDNGIKIDEQYMSNIINRMTKIENQFDTILK
jgi:predicted DNA-binding protein YlxM (UPF0122 family)